MRPKNPAKRETLADADTESRVDVSLTTAGVDRSRPRFGRAAVERLKHCGWSEPCDADAASTALLLVDLI